VTWESQTPSVVTVSATGLVTAVGTGPGSILARSVVDPSRIAMAQIIVAPLTVQVYPEALTLVQGRSASLSANVSGSTNGAVTWQSGAPQVATVSASGVVTALQPGVAIISAISVADPTKSGTSTITVVPPPTPITVTSGVPLTGLAATEGAETLYRVVVPAGATRLEVRTSGGTGDVDLVLRHALIPVPNEPFACGSFEGSNDEICVIESPSAGEWFFYLLAYQNYSGVTLLVTVTP
jgi:hypothetical protein